MILYLKKCQLISRIYPSSQEHATVSNMQEKIKPVNIFPITDQLHI